jgi:hypothetical protein
MLQDVGSSETLVPMSIYQSIRNHILEYNINNYCHENLKSLTLMQFTHTHTHTPLKGFTRNFGTGNFIKIFPALPDFLRGSGSGTGSTQPREYS